MQNELKKEWRILLCIFLVALAIRLPLALSVEPPAGMRDISYNVTAVGGHVKNFQPPLFIMFLRVIYSVFGDFNGTAVFAAHAVIGSLTVSLLYAITAHIRNRTAGYVAAGVAALYPNFLLYDLSVSPLTLTVFMVVLLIAAGLTTVESNRKAVISAVVASLGIMMNPLLVAIVPGLLITVRRRILFLLVLIAAFSPMMISNSIRCGGFVPVYDTRSYKFTLRYYRKAPDVWETVSAIYHNAAILTARGWDYNVMPNVSKRQWNTFYILTYAYLPVMILGFAGLIRYHRKELNVILMPILSFTVLYVLFSLFRIEQRLLAETALILYSSLLVEGIVGERILRRTAATVNVML